MHSVAWLEPIHASYCKNKGVTINISLLAKHLAGFHWIRSHSSVFYSKTVFFFNSFAQIQSRGYCPEFYTLISVFLLGGSSYFARYYRFRSRSTQQTGLFDRNKEARVSDSVFLFSGHRREPIRLKEPREHDSTQRASGILSCFGRFPSWIDSTQAGSRQRSAPGSAARINRQVGGLWSGLRAGLEGSSQGGWHFFYFHNKGKGRTCVKLMPEDQGSVGNYERRLLPKSFFEARTVEVSPYSKKLK